MNTQKPKDESKIVKVLNLFGLCVFFIVGAIYLFQTSSIAGLEYRVAQKHNELKEVRQEYQHLSLTKNQKISLEEISSKSNDLGLVSIDSPAYLLEPQNEFAQRN